MDKKTKGEKLFILLLIVTIGLALICLTGCSSSCFGCTVGCDEDDIGCVNGIGYESDGCGSEDSCNATWNCIDFVEPYDDGDGKVLLLSCATNEDSCSGESGCYNGTFCGGCGACGTCGFFCGSSEDYDVDESEFGCMHGCFTCGDTDGFWGYILENIYDLVGIE